jgi:hypothetical protein
VLKTEFSLRVVVTENNECVDIVSPQDANIQKVVIDFHSNDIVDYRLIFQSGVKHGVGQSIVGASAVLYGISLSVGVFTDAA